MIHLGEEEKELIQKLNDDLALAGTDQEKMSICQQRMAIALTIIAYKLGRKWL